MTASTACVVCDDQGCSHCPRVELPRADWAARDEGTIVLWFPISDAAVAFREEHIPEDALTWMSAIVIDHRMWAPLAEGLAAEGLVGRAA